jgi:hypothetical protein
MPAPTIRAASHGTVALASGRRYRAAVSLPLDSSFCTND